MTKRILQILGAGIAVATSAMTFWVAKPTTFPSIGGQDIVLPWAIGLGITVLVAPYVIFTLFRWISSQISKIRFTDLITAIAGLIVGLLLAALATIPLSQVQVFHLNWWLPFIALILGGYIGVAIGVIRKDEIHRLVSNTFRHREQTEESDNEDRSHRRRNRNAVIPVPEKIQPRILLDTSTIIDGRIVEISRTGFIMGIIVVPNFVLEELQRIADSADTLRRNRGRRGLDLLNQLQKDSCVTVEITDVDFDAIHEVDAKLVKLARELECPIVTNDFNLNKVADIQGVKVLNINDLANAVKLALMPGEEMVVRIIQEGKENGQGVGYLEDGTMIVVEGGKTFLHGDLEITVTRVLQTSAGRMIFAQPKSTNPSMSVVRRSS